MTFYLPNQDVRPVGAEIDEFVDAPPMPDAVAAVLERPRTNGGSIMNDSPDRQPDQQLEFLRVLEEENAGIDCEILQISERMWVIHGVIAVDGDVLMAEFDSYEDARIVLDQLRGYSSP